MKHVTDINIGGVDIWFGRWSMGGGHIAPTCVNRSLMATGFEPSLVADFELRRYVKQLSKCSQLLKHADY